MPETAFASLRPKVILGVAAHPDDLEFGVAGSVAKFIAEGAEAYYYILTTADKGSADRSLTSDQVRDIRRTEQQEAARILGVKEVFFADYEDGLLEVTPQLKCDIVRIIRQVRPDVVFMIDPTEVYSTTLGIVNHTDHRAAGQATLDAVYPLARDHLSFPELCESEKLEPHKVKTLLMTNSEKQNYYVDITNQFDTKLKALGAHQSQVGEAAFTHVRRIAVEAGRHVGTHYAEGFVRLDFSL